MLSLISTQLIRLGLLISIVFFLLPTTIYRASAAYLFFQPERSSVQKGETVEVKLRINTEGEAPTTTDAVILFNSSQLRLVEVKEAVLADRFFPKLFKRISNNKVFVGGAIEPGTQAKSGEGTLATLVFEGTVTSENIVTFLCEQGKTTDTNVNLKKDNKVVDVVNCAKVNQATITVTATTGVPTPTGGVGAPSATPGRGGTGLPSSPTPSLPGGSAMVTASATPTQTPTPTIGPTGITSILTPTVPAPSRLPVSGSIEGVKTAVIYGLVFVGVSLVIRLFLKF